MIGFGAGSLGRIAEDTYAQNIYDLDEYERTVQSGRFPVYRGYHLTSEDRIRRDVVHSLRCNFDVDLRAIESRHGIRFKTFFGPELRALEACQEDGLVEIDDARLTVTDVGKTFVSHICGLFDAYVPKKSTSEVNPIGTCSGCGPRRTQGAIC